MIKMSNQDMCERVKEGFSVLTDIIMDNGIRHTNDYDIEKLLMDLNRDVAYLISYVEHQDDKHGNR